MAGPISPTVPPDPTCGIALVPLKRFLAPRWWPVWIGYGLMRLLAVLPWSVQTSFARGLGRLAWLLARRDRRNTLVNLRLAFPAASEDERFALGRAHFESLTYSLFETALVWFGSPGALARLCEVQGREHLEAALARGRGVLLLGGHFTTNEIAAAAVLLTGHYADIMYKSASNPLINQLMLRRRTRSGNARLVPSDRFVEILRTLKQGGIVLYSPDQRFDGQGAVVVPLFGVPALSNPGTTFIARATGCVVLPYVPRRMRGGSRYVMSIGAPLEDFPSGDPKRDVARYHGLIEAAAAAAPEQYLWSYKRFRPRDGEPDPYRDFTLRGQPPA